MQCNSVLSEVTIEDRLKGNMGCVEAYWRSKQIECEMGWRCRESLSRLDRSNMILALQR
jgi:hypothetical protein